MDTKLAAAQISSIWDHLSRTQYFRGYRPQAVAITGLLGVAAALLQLRVVPLPAENMDGYLLIWTSVAGFSIGLMTWELITSYARSSSSLERRLTRQAVRQFVPCLFVGGAMTWAITTYRWESVVLLPGLWALCFSLGIFSSLPYMTPDVFWIAVFYAVAGSMGLVISSTPAIFSPAFMGLTFGGGQLAMAFLLGSARERQ